jgi:hypothetical protein
MPAVIIYTNQTPGFYINRSQAKLDFNTKKAMAN